jgi:hypothetical protein
MADVKLFLSCVSDEFGEYRDELRRALARPDVEVKIQEDFKSRGGDTLAMLEDYIESCDVVVHFAGEMAGSGPASSSVDDLLRRRPELAARLAEKGMDREALGRLTYTQWEAWLAIGFNKDGAERNLVIVAPAFGVKRGAKFALDDASRASQADHLARLKAIDFYPAKPFASADNLVARFWVRCSGHPQESGIGHEAAQSALRVARRPIRRPRRGPCRPAYRAAGAKGAPVALHGLADVAIV